jgi:hypothetical protein
MENDNRIGYGFTIPDLVELGDNLHLAKTALVICQRVEGEGLTTMASATGVYKELVFMLVDAMDNNPQLTALIVEAINMKALTDLNEEYENG